MRFQKLCKICKIKPLLFKTQWEIVLFEFVCRRERSWRCGRWIKSSAESEQEDWSCFSKKPQGANNSWMMARQHTSASVTSVFGFSVITDQNITIFWLMYNMLSNKKCLALSIDVQHVDAFNNYQALTWTSVQLVKKKLFINSLNGKLFAFDVKPCSNHSKQKVWLGVMKWNINCSNWE